MNLKDAVQEIIDSEEMDRSTPEEVIAGIESAMQEITNLRELTQKQANLIFDLYARIESVKEIAEKNLENIGVAVSDALIIVSRATLDNQQNRDKLDVVQRLTRAVAGQKWWVLRLIEMAEGRGAVSMPDTDEIPF